MAAANVARSVFLLVLLGLLPGASLGAERAPALLAHAGDDRFWLAQVESGPTGDQTLLSSRARDDITWTSWPPIAQRVLSMASAGDELIVLVDDGTWGIIDTDSRRAGTNAPPDQTLLAVASDASSVWFLAMRTPSAATQPQGAMRSTSEPATQAASRGAGGFGARGVGGARLSDVAALAPPPRRLIVEQIVQAQWADEQPIPSEIPRTAPISLAVVHQRPALAWRDAHGLIRITELGANGKWSSPAAVHPNSQADFKLLSVQEEPVLWVAGDKKSPLSERAGRIYQGDHFDRVTPLAVLGSAPPGGTDQVLAEAFERFRWIAASGQKIGEQDYELDGKPVASFAPIGEPGAPTIPLDTCAIIGAVTVLTAAAAAAGRRREEAAANQENVPIAAVRLAPLGLRFLAGLIDLAPFIAVFVAIGNFVPSGMLAQAAANPKLNSDLYTLMWLATATYIAHTFVAEAICGQSCGKMLFGLRVVTLGGKRATPTTILIRSALRILDVIPAGLPLLLILFTPQGQRLGDLAAGTIVVAADPAIGSDSQE